MHKTKTMGVYMIQNMANGNVYVGSSVHVYHRRNCHYSDLRNKIHRNSRLQKEWDCFGDDQFRFLIVEYVWDKDSLSSREQFWIDSVRPYYNIEPQARSNHTMLYTDEAIKQRAIESRREKMIGRKASAETKARMSASHMANPRRGYTLTEERKNHLSKINTGEKNPNWGLKRSDETRKKISDGNARKIRVGFVSPEGLEYREVKNLGWFCKEHNLNYWCMRDVDSGRSKSHKGWTKLPQ